MRTRIVMTVAFAIVAATAGVAAAQSIKIGASIALTGPVSREGKLVKDGYDFWLDHVNKQGGILVGGKRMPVQVVFYDDESNAQTSARLTEKLITEDSSSWDRSPAPSPCRPA